MKRLKLTKVQTAVKYRRRPRTLAKAAIKKALK